MSVPEAAWPCALAMLGRKFSSSDAENQYFQALVAHPPTAACSRALDACIALIGSVYSEILVMPPFFGNRSYSYDLAMTGSGSCPP